MLVRPSLLPAAGARFPIRSLQSHAEINRHRARHGLPALKDNFRDHFAKLRNPHPITLTAYSVHLLPRPKDWPDHTDMCPPLLAEPDQREFEPPLDLVEFLDPTKPKPICLSLRA